MTRVADPRAGARSRVPRRVDGAAADGIHIRLLGRPEIVRAGRPAARPRGAKTWAVLAYLLLSDERPARARLSDLCFAGARDPRAALRWALGDLRGVLPAAAEVTGDPIRLALPTGTIVDVWQVLDGEPGAVAACSRGALLEGMSFDSSEPLDRWIGFERRRMTVACAQQLQEAATRAERSGQLERAAHLNAELVTLEPFAEPTEPDAPG